MATNRVPVFPNTWKTVHSTGNTANTNRDGTTGSYVTLVTSPAGGCKVASINIKAGETTTAGMIRFFLNDGTNVYMIKEVPVDAIVGSGSVAEFEREIALDIDLQATWTIKWSTHNAERFYVSARYGEYAYTA